MKLIAALLLAVGSAGAFAADAGSTYMGAGLSSTRLFGDASGFNGSSLDRHGVGVRVFGGKALDANWRAEVAYEYTEGLHVNKAGRSQDLTMQTVSASALYSFNQVTRCNTTPFVKAGLAVTDFSDAKSATTVSPVFGAGLDTALTKDLSLRVEADRVWESGPGEQVWRVGAALSTKF